MTSDQKQSDSLKDAMLAYAPALAKDYEDFVRRQFEAMVAALGTELKGVYNSPRWARPFRAIRDNVHQEVLPFGRSSVYSLDDARLKQNATRYGEQVSLEWYGKLREKLGELENVTVSPPNWGGDVVVTGEHKGDKVRIEQQRIFKVSQLGTPFHQFPARIYVNGKFTSEVAYKKVVRGWNVPVVAREQRPKRVPIDVESRPKKYYFTFKVDYPAAFGYPARVGESRHEYARGMAEEEALARLKKNEERFDRDYPPGQRRRLYDFRLDAIYAWNDRLIWRASSGEPNPYASVDPVDSGDVVDSMDVIGFGDQATISAPKTRRGSSRRRILRRSGSRATDTSMGAMRL